MPTPISRSVLEQLYEEVLYPFLDGLTNMVKTFDHLFAVIEYPDVDWTLLDQLDIDLYYGLWEFVTKRSLSFELKIGIHFNRYDYELELTIDNCAYSRCIKRSYDDSFIQEEQTAYIHEIGRLIIDTVKHKFPQKK